MAVALIFFIGHVEAHLGRQGWKFGRQHRFGFAQNDVTAGAAGDASEDEHMAQVVEVGPVGNGISKAGANGLVNLSGPLVTGGHAFLYFHQALGQRKAGGDV